MVTTCVAVACQDRQDRDPGKNFHRFPTDPGRRSRWIAAVKREGWQPTSASRVSSDHFILSKNDDFLSPDYVPLQFQYVSSSSRPQTYFVKIEIQHEYAILRFSVRCAFFNNT
ncbi:THAP domain-containing protein 1-like [Tachypleus tridentatus]|uniref:THAP domain-containing protein 1-like n=1 Tax=Tachypleus tridentatus TaxID=6853 RepID=UPI003FCFAC31